MSRDTERERLFTRRGLILAGGKTLLFGLLAGRLYYLQVVESDRFVTLAEDNRINIRLLAPTRGRILDRRGQVLGTNDKDYRVVIVAEQTDDLEQTLDALNLLVPLSDYDRRRVLKEAKRTRPFIPVMVRENLSWDDVARIEVHAVELPGISIEDGQSRFYPSAEYVSHIVGYVAPVAEGDHMEDPMLSLPGFRVGRAGVEKVYDRPLRGVSGQSQVEVNAVGRVIREVARNEGEPGSDVILTLDLELQKFAYDRFGDEVGAVVLMDVRDGSVLALVSNPGFDPNAFRQGISAESWRALIDHPRSPLSNRAIAGQYAPGSTFKPVVALAALEKGAITPQTRVSCTGRLSLGNATFHCWRRGGHGSVDLRQAIAQSCDVFFYEAARRVGVDAISAMAKRFGFGARVGIDLPAERPGVMPTRDWKLKTLGSAWQAGETLIAGIGQGYVLATPLQLAVMAARIANGSQAVTPHLLQAFSGPSGIKPRPDIPIPALDINPKHLQIVQEGMINVVNAPWGTARSSAIREHGMEMAGKTGTSQVRRISKAERDRGVRRNEDLPWDRRDHALFVGYAPIEAPRYAVAVLVEHGGGGSKAAAPIARDILVAAQSLDERQTPIARLAVNDAARADHNHDHVQSSHDDIAD